MKNAYAADEKSWIAKICFINYTRGVVTSLAACFFSLSITLGFCCFSPCWKHEFLRSVPHRCLLMKARPNLYLWMKARLDDYKVQPVSVDESEAQPVSVDESEAQPMSVHEDQAVSIQ